MLHHPNDSIIGPTSPFLGDVSRSGPRLLPLNPTKLINPDFPPAPATRQSCSSHCHLKIRLALERPPHAMRAVASLRQELDDGDDVELGLVERVEDLVARH